MARFLRLVVATMALGVTTSGSRAAEAQIPTADGVIYACVRIDRDGDRGWLLRLVAAGEACRRNETPLQWNVVGPTGLRGDQGKPGAPGATGSPGAAGVQGEPGVAGPQGAPGAAAPAGAIGGQLASCIPGATLDGYLVHIPGRSFSVLTGADGAFQFDNVPSGAYTVSISAPTTAPEQRHVAIASFQVIVGDGLTMVPDAVQLATCGPDTIRPAPPVALSIAPPSPSGDLNPTISGQAESGALVQVFSGSNCQGALVGLTTAVAGTFSVTVPAVSGFNNVYHLTATDAAGNRSECSAPISYFALYGGDQPEPLPNGS